MESHHHNDQSHPAKKGRNDNGERELVAVQVGWAIPEGAAMRIDPDVDPSFPEGVRVTSAHRPANDLELRINPSFRHPPHLTTSAAAGEESRVATTAIGPERRWHFSPGPAPHGLEPTVATAAKLLHKRQESTTLSMDFINGALCLR